MSKTDKFEELINFVNALQEERVALKAELTEALRAIIAIKAREFELVAYAYQVALQTVSTGKVGFISVDPTFAEQVIAAFQEQHGG